jgi:hypothetical protein
LIQTSSGLIFNLFNSHFPAIRNYTAWTQLSHTPPTDPNSSLTKNPVTPSHTPPRVSSSLGSEFDPKNPVIVLLFNSQSPKNTIRHLKRYKDATSNYDFTVKQRLLAKEAKVVKNIEELENLVSIFLYYLHPCLNLVMQLDENLAKGYRKKNGGFVRLNPNFFIGW